MKKNFIKISLILVLLTTIIVLPLNVFASEFTDVQPIGIEGQQTSNQNTTNTTNTDNTNSIVEANVNTTTTSTTQNTDKVAEDKIAEDKVLPDAGFDKNMIYIISALIIFAVFAYIKVVKYNID